MIRRRFEVPLMVKAVFFHIVLLALIVGVTRWVVRIPAGQNSIVDHNELIISFVVLYVPPILSIGMFRRHNTGFWMYLLATVLYLVMVFLWSKNFRIAQLSLDDAASFGLLALTTLPVVSVVWAILSKFTWI